MGAISNYDTTVVVKFDRDIHSHNINTAHLGFSVVWFGINRYNQKPQNIEVKFDKCKFVDSKTLVLKTFFKDNSIDDDLTSFRNAVNPKLKYSRTLGNIYGNFPKDMLPDFEMPINVSNLSPWKNINHHENINPIIKTNELNITHKLSVISSQNINSQTENVNPIINATSPNIVFKLELTGDIRP